MAEPPKETAPQRFSRTAPGYAVSGVHAAGRTLQMLVEALAPEPKDVALDVAGGTGNAAFALSPHVARVVLLDPAPGMREQALRGAAERGIANVEVHDGLAESLPFAAESFDLVFSRIAPHHFTDIEQSVREMARVLKPGGRAAVVDLQGEDDPEADSFLHALERIKDPTHVKSYSAGEWRSFFEAAGLSVELVEPMLIERDEGITVGDWCGVARSGPEAEAEVRRRLLAAPPRLREHFAVRQEAGGEVRFNFHVVLISASKASRSRRRSMKFDTLAIHAGQEPDPTTGAIMTPIYMTSTYVQAGPGEHKGYEYSRTRNPTREALEKCIAALEEGRFGLAFASGCAAADALMHLFDAGDHIVCSDDVYGGTFRLFDKVFKRQGLQFSFVDLSDPARVAEHIGPQTRAVWIETPTNPMLKLVDLKAVAEVCREKGVLSIVDNTFMTPYFQRPLEFGIDVVVHSTTKYLNGHSDVVGGAIVTSHDELAKRLFFIQNAVGGVAGPMDSFLVLRGLKTLHVRMERHAQNAMAVARWLAGRPEVERVTFPGLESHPQYALARKQMRGFGGMLTFVIHGGLPAARAFLKACRIWACAESLGGVESLIEHPAIMTHASVPPENRAKLGINDGLIRLSCGIEAVEDLIQDLDQAFAAARKA